MDLSHLLPQAIAWAEAQCARICEEGAPLDAIQLRLARAVGVLHPQSIRVCTVNRVPAPTSLDLRRTAIAVGLIGSATVGLTFGYGIYVVEDCVTNRLLSHEFRHVQQYEAAGSITSFLTSYLGQLLALGYDNTSFEIDARAHERDG
jgi:hypothetical protein